MKTTNNTIMNRITLQCKQLFFSIQVLIAIAAMLAIVAHPCGAIKSHSHIYKEKSISCKTGMRTLECHCGKTKRIRGKKGHKYYKVKDGVFIVNKCKNCGKVSKKYLSKDIPTYWDSHIIKALKTAKKRGDLPGYVYLTDPHWNKNAGNSPAIVNYIVRQMGYSYAVCGGDIVTGCYDNKQDAIEEIKDFYDKFSVPVLTVMGNHDANRNGNSNPNTFLSTYDINKQMYAHNPPGSHMSHGGDFAYIDDGKHKVRYISFYFDETEEMSSEVIDSIDRAVTSLDADWSVVLLSHAYWHYAHPGDAPYAKPEAKQLAAKLLDIQAHSKASIVLWHVGHIHRDKHDLLSDGQGNHILVVSTNCDAFGKSTCWGGLAMSKGTVTEQVVEIVQIDKSIGKIYMTRIGAGKIRCFDIERRPDG